MPFRVTSVPWGCSDCSSPHTLFPFCTPSEIMPKATDITILEALFFRGSSFRCPIKFGSGVDGPASSTSECGSRHATNSRRSGSAACRRQRSGPGQASTVSSTKGKSEAVRHHGLNWPPTTRLRTPSTSPNSSRAVRPSGQTHSAEAKLADQLPVLALVAASPLMRHCTTRTAVHGRTALILSAEYMNHDLSEYLDKSFKGEPDKYTRAASRRCHCIT